MKGVENIRFYFYSILIILVKSHLVALLGCTLHALSDRGSPRTVDRSAFASAGRRPEKGRWVALFQVGEI